MDSWKYFGITHRDHAICNPLGTTKLKQLIRVLRLERGARVLDIASGKGEFIIRVAERFEARAVAVDLSPYFIAAARQRMDDRACEADVTFLEMSGADFEPPDGERYDLVSCLGASWIFDGFEGTLRALSSMAAPGAVVVVGEPFWKAPPPPEYAEVAGKEAVFFGTHHENVLTGEELGLRLTYSVVSNRDEWDTYHGLQWFAADA